MARRPIASVVVVLVVIGLGVGTECATGDGGLVGSDSGPTPRQLGTAEQALLRQAAGLISDGIKLQGVGGASNGRALDIQILKPTADDISKLEHRTNRPIITATQYLSAATTFLRVGSDPLFRSVSAPGWSCGRWL